MSNWLVGKKAVANALGVSVSTLKRYLKRYPDFPANRRGGTIYVATKALEAWVERRELKRCPRYQRNGTNAPAFSPAGKVGNLPDAPHRRHTSTGFLLPCERPRKVDLRDGDQSDRVPEIRLMFGGGLGR